MYVLIKRSCPFCNYFENKTKCKKKQMQTACLCTVYALIKQPWETPVKRVLTSFKTLKYLILKRIKGNKATCSVQSAYLIQFSWFNVHKRHLCNMLFEDVSDDGHFRSIKRTSPVAPPPKVRTGVTALCSSDLCCSNIKYVLFSFT